MSRNSLIVALFIWTLLACNISANTHKPTPQPIVSATVEVTQEPATAIPTVITLPTVSNNTPSLPPTAVLPHVCNPRLDWFFYSVIAGDTLGNIANQVNSTITDLTIANCLANPNNLMVGQQIRVPRLPVTPVIPTPFDRTPRIIYFVRTSSYPPMLEWRTENAGKVLIYVSDSTGENRLLGTYEPNSSIFAPVTSGVATIRLTMRDVNGKDVIGPNGLPVYAIAQTSGGNPQGDPECPQSTTGGIGTIEIDPLDANWSSCYFIKGGNQVVTLSWANMPTNIFSIDYWFMPTSGGCDGAIHGNPNVVTSDSNAIDSVNATWTVGYSSCAGLLYAYGYGEGKSIESIQRPIIIR